MTKHSGAGVSTNILDEAGLSVAFEKARAFSRKVLIERRIPHFERVLEIHPRSPSARVHVQRIREQLRGRTA